MPPDRATADRLLAVLVEKYPTTAPTGEVYKTERLGRTAGVRPADQPSPEKTEYDQFPWNA